MSKPTDAAIRARSELGAWSDSATVLALLGRIEALEASTAAMRNTLEVAADALEAASGVRVMIPRDRDEPCSLDQLADNAWNEAKAALATDAGSALLAELRALKDGAAVMAGTLSYEAGWWWEVKAALPAGVTISWEIADEHCRRIIGLPKDAVELGRRYQEEIAALRDRVKKLEDFKRRVDEALDSGDGSYRP